MPKPRLIEEDEILESQIIETMMAGHKAWRPDLPYPASHSDMQGCARSILMSFDVKRRPLQKPLRVRCSGCEGIGHLIIKVEEHYREVEDCPLCEGRGWTEGY